ncbi:hypothetical protein N8D56_25720 (plasmid) [Devosia sp. A8/3-2]|nr:hypothetical protein N8D56_25720 [Devosia sp. A8/3-2]
MTSRVLVYCHLPAGNPLPLLFANTLISANALLGRTKILFSLRPGFSLLSKSDLLRPAQQPQRGFSLCAVGRDPRFYLATLSHNRRWRGHRAPGVKVSLPLHKGPLDFQHCGMVKEQRFTLGASFNDHCVFAPFEQYLPAID